MKRIVLTSLLILAICLGFSGEGRCYNYPLFKLPSNYGYKLFNYKPRDLIVLKKMNKNKKNKIVFNSQQNSLYREIKGVFVTQNGNWVLIGTSICKKGDVINGYRIEEINVDKVVFLKDGKKVTIYLNTQPIPSNPK